MEHTEAYINGWLAHMQLGKSVNNPYDSGSQPYSFHQFEQGWAARYEAEKHGHDLSLDDILD